MTADNGYFLAGLVSITIGSAFIYWPLAFLVPGIIVCSLVVFAWVRRSRDNRTREDK